MRLSDGRLGRDLSTRDRARRGQIIDEIAGIGEIVEGRVEICHEGVWSAIYDENWSNRDAAVACQQLEFSRYGFSARERGYRFGMVCLILLHLNFFCCL